MARPKNDGETESAPRAVNVTIPEGRAALDDAYNALPDLRPERIRERAVGAAQKAAGEAFSAEIAAMVRQYTQN